MRLVVKPDRGGDVGRPHSVEQQTPGRINPAPGQVPVRRQAELPTERAHQMCRIGVENPRGLVEGQSDFDAAVEEIAQSMRQAAVTHLGRFGHGPPEVCLNAFDDEREPARGLELVARPQHIVKPIDAVPQCRVLQRGGVDGGPDPGPYARFEVEHPFAESAGADRPAIVRYVRR